LPHYQLYYLGENGSFCDLLDATCDDDTAAVQFASDHCKIKSGELWSIGRRIAIIKVRNQAAEVVLVKNTSPRHHIRDQQMAGDDWLEETELMHRSKPNDAVTRPVAK